MVVKLERPRYILVEFLGTIPTPKLLIRRLREKVAYLGGQLSLASAHLHIIDVISSHAIIRCDHLSRDIVESSIQLLDLDDTVPVVRSVSGTIRSINEILGTDLQDIEV